MQYHWRKEESVGEKEIPQVLKRHMIHYSASKISKVLLVLLSVAQAIKNGIFGVWFLRVYEKRDATFAFYQQ